MHKIFLGLVLTVVMQCNPATAHDSVKIEKIEKRIAQLESEVKRLKLQEERASKYLKCIRKADGNSLTIAFKIISCIRK